MRTSGVSRTGWLLVVLLGGQAMASLDGAIVNRTLFVAGLAAFTGASIMCGAATTIWTLVAARIAQGAAAAFMVPQVLSLIQRCFEGAERVRALSRYSAVLSLGVAAGQVLGGVVVTADLAGSTWRAVFLVNAPIGAALLAAAWRHLPAGRAGARAFDVAGMLALAAPMVLLVLPLAVGRE